MAAVATTSAIINQKIIFTMKKIIFTALAVAAFGVAEAQEIRFGAKVGAGASMFTGDVEDAEPKLSGHIGGFVEFKFKKFAIQPEILFSNVGAEWNYNYRSNNDWYYEGPIDNVQYTANLYYLHVPVMAKYYVIDPLSVEFGPQLGILLDAETEYTTTYWNGSDTTNKENVKDDLKTIDLGLNFGATYNFKNRMFVSARYTLGLIDIDDSTPEPGESATSIHNHVVQASFGYKF